MEYVCPWCIGGGAKLWEWAANPQGAIFTLLLRQSSSTGGGDYGGPGPQLISVTDGDSLSEALAKGIAREGMPMPLPEDSIVGRWAGDPVYLVGDYDESGLYEESESYRNISRQLVEEWNRFIELDDRKLTFEPCEGHE